MKHLFKPFLNGSVRLFVASLSLALLPFISQAQTDSTQQKSPILNQAESADISEAVSNPVWFLLRSMAPVFNIGLGYSHIVPLADFGNRVSLRPAFTFDIGLNLTRIFGNQEADWQVYLGFTGDYTNFGKSNEIREKKGDTTYLTTVKNSFEAYSPYLEFEYNSGVFCPFVSLGYTGVYINPYRETEMQIKNSTTNYSEFQGSYLLDKVSHAMHFGFGTRFKYRLNEHSALMLDLKSTIVYGASTSMVDITSVSFGNNGETFFQTANVNPAYLLLTTKIKYNF